MDEAQKLLLELCEALFSGDPKSYPCECPPADEVTRTGKRGLVVVGAIPHYSCVYCRLQAYVGPLIRQEANDGE